MKGIHSANGAIFVGVCKLSRWHNLLFKILKTIYIIIYAKNLCFLQIPKRRAQNYYRLLKWKQQHGSYSSRFHVYVFSESQLLLMLQALSKRWRTERRRLCSTPFNNIIIRSSWMQQRYQVLGFRPVAATYTTDE